MFDLFFTFFKIGLFTFGGGYAMIPLIEKEIIHNKKWIEEDELLEIISIAQMTPGPIAINAATFVGKKTKGFLGSVVATIGVTLPSLVIISSIAIFFENSFNNIYVQHFFTGVRACITAMIFFSVKKLFKNIKSLGSLIIFILSSFFLFLGVSPIKIILIFSLTSILLYLILHERYLIKMKGDKC